MRVATILVSSAALVCGCAKATEPPPPKGPFAAPGVYVLQSLNGERLPAQTYGTENLVADTLFLSDQYTFKHVEVTENEGNVEQFVSAGEIAGGISAIDSLVHVSFLQNDPSFATFQMIITKQGQATMVEWPFTFRYQR